jgi:hypothetical protein
LFESLEVGKEVDVHEIDEVIAGEGDIVVDLARLVLGSGPGGSLMGLIEDELVCLPDELALLRSLLLEVVEVFQEEEPGGLLGVVQFRRAPGLFPEDVIKVFEGLFEHGTEIPENTCEVSTSRHKTPPR